MVVVFRIGAGIGEAGLVCDSIIGLNDCWTRGDGDVGLAWGSLMGWKEGCAMGAGELVLECGLMY